MAVSEEQGKEEVVIEESTGTLNNEWMLVEGGGSSSAVVGAEQGGDVVGGEVGKTTRREHVFSMGEPSVVASSNMNIPSHSLTAAQTAIGGALERSGDPESDDEMPSQPWRITASAAASSAVAVAAGCSDESASREPPILSCESSSSVGPMMTPSSSENDICQCRVCGLYGMKIEFLETREGFFCSDSCKGKSKLKRG